MAESNIGLVYGGANIGIMGQLANQVLQHQGKVFGVIPKKIYNLEVGHEGLTQLILTKTMHERKEKMYQLSDAFLVLPGGIGTLEEFLETLTWIQLGFHRKPLFLFNHNNHFQFLLKHLEFLLAQGFLHRDTLTKLIFATM